MSFGKPMSSITCGTPGAGASCVRFFELMVEKHPRLFRAAPGVLAARTVDGARHVAVTPEEGVKILALADEGLPPRVIAERIGRGDTTVANWLRRKYPSRKFSWQKKRPVLTDAQLARMVKLARAGRIYEEIARAVGCARSSVSRHLRGVPGLVVPMGRPGMPRKQGVSAAGGVA